MKPNRMAAASAALALVFLLLAGCEAPGRSSGSSSRPAVVAEDGRVSFRSYNFTKDTAGAFVVMAQVRVRAVAGTGSRDYYLKAGDPIGRQEPDGDYRTGLTVEKIDKGQRPIPTRIEGKEMTVVMESYYLLARGMGGQQVFWLASSRPDRPATPK